VLEHVVGSGQSPISNPHEQRQPPPEIALRSSDTSPVVDRREGHLMGCRRAGHRLVSRSELALVVCQLHRSVQDQKQVGHWPENAGSKWLNAHHGSTESAEHPSALG